MKDSKNHIFTPEVSIIVPVYKVEKVLRRCVDSILDQTFSDFELILVDDGSPDDSGVICDEFAKKDSRVIVLHQGNQGASAARNAGLDIAKGKYVAFVDSDDYVERDYLEQLVTAMESHQADLAMCDISFLDACIPVDIIKCKFPEGKNLISQDEILKNVVGSCANGYAPLWNKLYKRDIIETHHLRIPEGISIGEDYLFNILYFIHCVAVVYVRRPLYNYFKAPDGLYLRYRREFVIEVMQCRQKTIELLKPYEHYNPGFVRVNKKFLADIERYISQVYENESNPRNIISECYRNIGVKDCMRQLLDKYNQGDQTALTDQAQIRIAKLVSSGHNRLAAWYTDYMLNPTNSVRRIRERHRTLKEFKQDKNLVKVD